MYQPKLGKTYVFTDLKAGAVVSTDKGQRVLITGCLKELAFPESATYFCELFDIGVDNLSRSIRDQVTMLATTAQIKDIRKFRAHPSVVQAAQQVPQIRELYDEVALTRMSKEAAGVHVRALKKIVAEAEQRQEVKAKAEAD